MQNKNKEYKKVIDLILEKKDAAARTELEKIIQNHPKMKKFKTALSEMGLNYKSVLVEDKIYDDIKSILEKFDKNLQLKILDVVCKEINNEN